MKKFLFFKYFFLLVVYNLLSTVCISNTPIDSSNFYIKKLEQTSIEELIKNKEQTFGYQNVAFHYLIGKYYFESNEFSKASKEFEIILEKHKSLISKEIKYKIHVNIGLCKKNMCKYENAIVFFSIAQNHIQTTNDSIEQSFLLYDIAETYFEWEKYELAGEYFQRLELQLKINKNIDLLTDTYIKLGAISQKMNLHTSAISYYEKAKKLSENDKMSENYVNSLVNLAIENIYFNKFDKAALFLNESQSISQKIGYLKGEIYSLNQIARLFVAKNDYPSAMIFLQQSENLINKKTDYKTKILIYSNIASVYKLMKEYSKALSFLDKLKNLPVNSIQCKIENLLNLAEIHKLLKNYNFAEKYIDSCIFLSEQHNLLNFTYQAHFQASEILMLQNKYKEAELILQKLLEKENEINDLYFKSGIFLRISELYEAKKMENEALFYYKNYHDLQLLILEKANSFELKKLENDSKMDKLRHILQKTKLSNELKKKKIAFQKKWVLVLSIGAIVFIILSVLLAKLYLEKNRAYKDLINRNIELAEQIPFKTEKKLVERFAVEKNNKSSDLIASLIDLFEKENIYLQADISMQKVADLLHTNRTYLSAAIQEVLNTNFPTLINKYRIEKARTMLMDNSQKYSIEGIALNVGFNSKSTFNTAFKKFTGVTPSEMRNQNAE